MHDSTLVTLKQVVDQQLLFNIPIYQRLYVWGADQIKTLLDDLRAAYEADKQVFYLGGALVIKQAGSAQRVHDLIDGQQRFTTLWLLSIALERLRQQRGRNEINHLVDYRQARVGQQMVPRIRFAIRPEVSNFFDALLNDRPLPEAGSASTLGHAISEIESYFNNHLDVCLTGLSDFIYHRVQLVLTTVPPGTDLNKLFEVINNRGMQLQHHEILKARLLAQIDDRRQRELYGLLWDACSHMDDYVEKNLRAVTGLKLAPLFERGAEADGQEALADHEQVRRALEHIHLTRQEQSLTLDDILRNPAVAAAGQPVEHDDEGYESDPVRSVITFPMLLQHVLRIFLLEEGLDDIDKILDKELLAIFQRHWLDELVADTAECSPQVMRFIDLLWRGRYLFDKHVIKWVQDGDDTVHAIRALRISSTKNYQSLVRESKDSDTGLAMLQSMLYHSQQMTTHYWLTPFLQHVLKHGGEQAHLYLKFLDNYLLCADSKAGLVTRTHQFLQTPWTRGALLQDLPTVLGGADGTNFAHYWFYKLEYILWEKYRGEKGAAWQAFRMTAKNSVEHVSPQTPKEYDSNVVIQGLDRFGNLALVSRSINSEFGNKPYLVKRAHFHERNAGRLDSLKLALIYENSTWNDTQADLHRAQMVEHYLEYMAGVDKEVQRFAPV